MIEIRFVGMYGRDVARLGRGDRQGGQAAAAEIGRAAASPVPGAGRGDKRRRADRLRGPAAVQEERDPPVGVGMLGQVVVDDQNVPPLRMKDSPIVHAA